MQTKGYSFPPFPSSDGSKVMSPSDELLEQLDYAERVLRRVFVTAQYNIGSAAATDILKQLVNEMEAGCAES